MLIKYNKPFIFHSSDEIDEVQTPAKQRPSVPSATGNVGRAKQKPQTVDDGVINTVRITAIKNSLRPAIIPCKAQPPAESKFLADTSVLVPGVYAGGDDGGVRTPPQLRSSLVF